MRGLKDKKGQAWETLIPWIIAIVVLILSFGLYMILSGKGEGAINFLKDIFTFGRFK